MLNFIIKRESNNITRTIQVVTFLLYLLILPPVVSEKGWNENIYNWHPRDVKLRQYLPWPLVQIRILKQTNNKLHTYMFLYLDFLKFNKFGSSCLKIKSASRSVCCTFLTWTHDQRHKGRWIYLQTIERNPLKPIKLIHDM